jgi:hypothetical protein
MVVTRLFQQVQNLEPQNLPALRIEKANLHRVQQYLAQRFWRINSLNFPPVRQSIAKRFVHDVYIGESFSNGMQRFGVCVDCAFKCGHPDRGKVAPSSTLLSGNVTNGSIAYLTDKVVSHNSNT